MKILDGATRPKIFVDDYVFDKLSKYAKAMTQRATIICDCIVDGASGNVEIFDANLVEQTVDYIKNSSKYEEISKYIGYRVDKKYGTIYSQCMIRNTLSSNHDAFDGKDFSYFEKLCEVTDWLIVGEITKETSGRPSLHLWYLDLENRIAYGYCDPSGAVKDGFDATWEACSADYYEYDKILEEVRSLCKSKPTSYGSCSNNYGTSKYGGTTYCSSTPATPPPKSELNKTDPDISKIV